MYNDPSTLDETVERLNKVSPSFCMAKWMHTSLHLHMGRTHSCYLPETHKIPLKELKKDPSALHNTAHKMKARKQMLEGKRPAECKICWDIEDLPGKNYSDRHYRGQESWTEPFIDEVANSKWDEPINPRYLEVSFSSACNFKCSYCNPTVSTAWLKEIKEHGGYKLSQEEYHSLFWLKAKGLMPLDDTDNPYIDAFWKWWPTVKKDLMFFRLTGGEPLLSPDTFKVMKMMNEDNLPNLEFSVNTNLGVPQKNWDKFMGLLLQMLDQKRIRHFMLHTSVDTYGEQAEYIRNGLDFKVFENYVEDYLEKVPNGSIAFMCTFNALSITDYKNFIDWIISLRKRFHKIGRNIFLDIPHLQGPALFNCRVLTEDYHTKMEELIEYMRLRVDNDYGIKPAEILKLERILEWMKEGIPKTANEAKALNNNRKDFHAYFSEHDRRRGTDFRKTFPEMVEFYDYCESLRNL